MEDGLRQFVELPADPPSVDVQVLPVHVESKPAPCTPHASRPSTKKTAGTGLAHHLPADAGANPIS